MRSCTASDGNCVTLSMWNHRLVAVRRGNPLHYGHTDRGIYLASLPKHLPRDCQAVADETAMQWTLKGGNVYVSTKEIPAESPAAEPEPAVELFQTVPVRVGGVSGDGSAASIISRARQIAGGK